MDVWKWLATKLHGTASNTTISPSTDFDCVSAYEFYKKSLQENPLGWCEWHLNIDDNDNAIKIAETFHQDFKKLNLSPDMKDEIDTICQTFSEFKLPKKTWDQIKSNFMQAREDKDPSLIIRADTMDQQFTSRINNDLAANTYHSLILYCTVLNCPILAQTQAYTEAITSIFFHPKLDKLLVREKTVYRGAVLEDKKLIANYKKDATIITTTFLSTSTERWVAERWCNTPSDNQISILGTYNIKNIHRRTALNLGKSSQFPDEEEVLILRYVPFTITSLRWENDGRRMEICFDEHTDY